jgi:3-oxoacyl-[acyl-carrier protein] reductase
MLLANRVAIVTGASGGLGKAIAGLLAAQGAAVVVNYARNAESAQALVAAITEQGWDIVLDTNLKGAFLCTKAVTRPMMKARFGRIVNIGSVSGLLGTAGQANYAAAKAGLIGLTRSNARELASRNITVNCVAPGAIAAGMLLELNEEQRAAYVKQIPLERLGKPEDVAATVLFLVSAGEYITGQTLAVDGGLTMQ